jgi:ribonuclease HI
MNIKTAGVVSHKAGTKFGVVVKTDSGERTYIYEVPKETTLNQVELMAIKFALLGTKEKATISTPSKYIIDMVRREEPAGGLDWADPMEGWVRKPKSNVELINEIRSLLVSKKAEIVYGKNEEIRVICKS